MLKTDHNGWKFYDELPEGWRRATLDDFHTDGRKKIGMEFIIQWITRNDYYQLCTVSHQLKGSALKPFIEDGRVFIKP